MRRIVVVFILSLLMAGHFEALADEGSINAKSNQVTVRLTEYRFEPAQIILRSGEKVELILINEGTVRHEFVTDAIKNIDRDMAYDEDRQQVRKKNGPRVMAILRNFAISLLRLNHYQNIAKALRYRVTHLSLAFSIIGLRC